MSWIDVISGDEAAGELKKVYDRISKERGKLSNIMLVQSLKPSVMSAHLDLYLSIMFQRSGLSRPERELVAAVVSYANGCGYCTNHHEEALRHYWKDDERVRLVVREGRHDLLSERHQAMIAYAVKLTRNSSAVREDDVELLRAAGLADDDILDLVLVISYFNFVNRIANGLGVSFDPTEMSGYKY